MPSSQLIFNISLKTHYNLEDFIVSDSNQEVFDYINSWPNWVDMGVFLFGPKSCGKTHLSHIWARKSKALIIPAADFHKLNISESPLRIVIEDIQNLSSDGFEKLFHLYNHLYQKKGNLIVTSDRPLCDLNLSLQDLKSRLSRLVTVQVKSPDENLMRLYIMKLFSDLQVSVSSNEINYLGMHLSRDFKKVFSFVKKLNDTSLAEKRKITIPFIKIVLGK